MQGKLPRSTVLVDVERVYFQCQKALVRSRLWDPAAQVARSTLPSTGTMIKALVDDASFDAENYDEGYPAHMARTILLTQIGQGRPMHEKRTGSFFLSGGCKGL